MNASKVAHSIRSRLPGTSRYLQDSEVVSIGLAASCQNPKDLIEYLCDQNLAREIIQLDLGNVAITLQEFEALFTSFCPARYDDVDRVIRYDAFAAFIRSFSQDLQCTITERDQKIAWGLGPVKVLVYVSLHSVMNTEERVGCALGGVVRADMRRLEDLRATFEGSAMDVFLVGASILALVKCLFI
jgi:hypothetical protein